MSTVWLVAKFIGIAIAGLIALVILFYACVLIRKSMPYVFASDIEQLATTGPYNSREMATEMCGTPADLVGSAKTQTPLLGLPEASVISWRPLYPLEGTASVLVTGIGFIHAGDRTIGPCRAIMTFRYRFAWADNGRAVVLESSILDKPTITRQ